MRLQLTRLDIDRAIKATAIVCLVLIGIVVGIQIERTQDPVKARMKQINKELAGIVADKLND